MDPYSFSFLDPDPGGENLRGENRKMQGKLKERVILLQILTKCGKNPLYIFIHSQQLYLINNCTDIFWYHRNRIKYLLHILAYRADIWGNPQVQVFKKYFF